MPRGFVLPFPSRPGFAQDDREELRRFAAAFSGAQIDILTRRGREIVTLALAGRQLGMERDAAGGRLLAESIAIGSLLAMVPAALLPGGTIGWRSRMASPC